MEMNFIEKVMEIFKYMISSFMNIEILLIVLLFFAIVFLNVRRNNLQTKIASISVFVTFFIIIIFYNFGYVEQCITSTLKLLLTYFYFPSTGIYFVEVILTTIFLFYIICSQKMDPIAKKVNIGVIAVLYVFYLNTIALMLTNKINIADKASLYSNNQVISFIQVGNLIWLIWVIFVCIYGLFIKFKEKDKA